MHAAVPAFVQPLLKFGLAVLQVCVGNAHGVQPQTVRPLFELFPGKITSVHSA